MNEAMSALIQSPWFSLFLTLGMYRLALAFSHRCHGHPLTNPLLWTIVGCVLVLNVCGLDYARYEEGAQIINLMLGPATVALAVPLYAQLSRLQRAAGPVLTTLVAGSVLGIVSAVGMGWLAGFPEPLLRSLATRSVTTPIAMSVTESIGGVPALAAAFVVVSGLVGAIIFRPLLKWLKLDQDIVLGVSVGISAHGLGTARAILVSESAGAFSGLAMGLNGLLTAVLVPVASTLLH